MKKLVLGPIIVGFVFIVHSFGQFTHPDCDPLQASDFSIQEMFNQSGELGALGTDGSLDEPVGMDFDGIWNGNTLSYVNVYFVERQGAVKFFDGSTNQVRSIGDIDVWGTADNGLMGIALDPNFKDNRWIYLWYSPNELIGQNRQARLSRFTLNNDQTINMGSEKNLIEILLSKTDQWHSGGPMTFDSYGDLWITIGNNSRDHDANNFSHFSRTDSTTSDEWGSSNTASMRGSIIRIHPNDTASKGYTIPTETPNFGEYWAQQFENDNIASNDSWAIEYRNPSLVLPEIYTKGHRSNFSISVHPTKRWLAWGDVNYQSTRDEFNLVTHPVFGGYPYFHGANFERTAGHQATFGYLQDPDAPKNESPLNSGVTDLPPSSEPAFTGQASVAISGPIYAYDRNLNSDSKFPPHWDNSWLTMNYNNGMLWIHKIDSTDVTASSPTDLVSTGQLFNGIGRRQPIYSKYGPDGALYIMMYGGSNYNNNNNPGLIRISYTGSCQLSPITHRERGLINNPKIISLANGFRVDDNKSYRVELYSHDGKKVWNASSEGPKTFSLKNLEKGVELEPGLYIVSVHTELGNGSARVFLSSH